MKTLLAATLAAVTFLTTGMAEAANNRFELHNYSGEDVFEVYIRGPATEWSDGLLGPSILEYGDSLYIDPLGHQCDFDVMLVTYDGSEHVFHEYVCNISDVELTSYSGGGFRFVTY
ncbi:hypothetical protein [Rhizobium sp. 007]|uniref:hypothetical protein n=1 Tax=Rhizobium sp. 007 TaxID=2785056 RepID=UPI00188F756C|nr:hypothetical protein [Rhizobium sp. 007]QPB22669.1 hypothetical protein ISN39_24090 [Rhizobium sp. 007]